MDEEERSEREGMQPSREPPAAPDEPATAFPVGREATRGGGTGPPIIERDPEEPEPIAPPIAEPEPEKPIIEPEPEEPEPLRPLGEPEPLVPIGDPEPEPLGPLGEPEPDEDERTAY